MIVKKVKSAAVKVILSEADKKIKKDSVRNKRGLLTGKNWDTLKAKEKDDLLRLACEKAELIDAAGTVL
jgi:hypothetical protein